MEWVAPTFVGFILGLVGALLALVVQRHFQKRDDAAYTRKILQSLTVEITEGIDRAKYMMNLADKNSVSFSRIYTQLWDSTSQRIAATLENTEVLELLHRLYYRFDLINFNCEHGRPGAGAGFAGEYMDEMRKNLSKLQALIKEL